MGIRWFVIVANMSEHDDERWSVKKMVSSLSPPEEPLIPPEHSAAFKNSLSQISSLLDQIKHQPPAAQIGAGAVCGYINGYVVKKVAKMALIGIGGSLLVLTIAHNQGYLSINRSSVRSDLSTLMTKLQKKVKSVKRSEAFSDESIIIFCERFSPRVFSFIRHHSLFLSGTSAGFLLSFAF